MYTSIIRPILFLLSPEKAHKFSFLIFKILLKIPFMGLIFKKMFVYENPKLEQNLFGLTFKNPVGLAAGFDKDAELIEPLSHLGFGFIEIGTLTPKPQDGNPEPRLFRLPKDKALINRMGFNNKGVKTAVERLRNRKSEVLIGGNIGKNKITPNENATADYLTCFDALYDVVDYFTVNVSSPNTPNLRALQEKKPLMELLGMLQKRNNEQLKPKPILLKIAPDLTNSQLDDIIEIVTETKIAGLIAHNTTIQRDDLKTSENQLSEIGNGGLSGKPLKNRSTEVIKYLFEKSDRKLKIIGVGGIHSPQDALEKLKVGACLVQLYTGFIYEGPALIKKINQLLVKEKYS